MIAEPIQGVGGFATPPDGLFGRMGKELDNRGILFISDEVQTGWGRTGEHFWGYQAHGIVPDMLTFAKGVGNGITLAGVVARAEIMDTIEVLQFSTFGGNPLSAVAGLATLRTVQDEDLQGNAKVDGGAFRRGDGSPLPTPRPWIAEMRGRGLMWAFECCEPGGIEPDKAAHRRVPRGVQATRTPRGQGRPLRQRDPARTDAQRHGRRARRGHRRPPGSHRRHLLTRTVTKGARHLS